MQPSVTLLKSSCLSDSMAPALHSADSSVPSMVAQPGLSCMPCRAAALSEAVQRATTAQGAYLAEQHTVSLTTSSALQQEGPGGSLSSHWADLAGVYQHVLQPQKLLGQQQLQEPLRMLASCHSLVPLPGCSCSMQWFRGWPVSGCSSSIQKLMGRP